MIDLLILYLGHAWPLYQKTKFVADDVKSSLINNLISIDSTK